MGTDRLRPAPHVRTYWTYDLPFGKDRHVPSTTRSSTSSSAGGRPGHRAHPDRPPVPAHERTTDAQSGGRGRRPQRDGRQGTAENDQRPPGPNGNVSGSTSARGAEAEPTRRAHRPPTNPASRVSTDLYGPGFWNADLGLAKNFRLGGQSRINFEALFINAFNHRNTLVGNDRWRDVQHRLDDVRAVNDRREQRAADSVQGGVLFLAVVRSQIGSSGFGAPPEVPNYRTTEITELPNYRATELPNYRATELLSH